MCSPLTTAALSSFERLVFLPALSSLTICRRQMQVRFSGLASGAAAQKGQRRQKQHRNANGGKREQRTESIRLITTILAVQLELEPNPIGLAWFMKMGENALVLCVKVTSFYVVYSLQWPRRQQRKGLQLVHPVDQDDLLAGKPQSASASIANYRRIKTLAPHKKSR